MEKLNAHTSELMDKRFGHDTLIALATVDGTVPNVRAVNGYYENGSFYVITDARSGKMAQLRSNPSAAICGDWFTAHGIGENLGWIRNPENAELAERLRNAFAEWYDNGHTNEEDENTVILRLRLTDGILFHHGTRYEIDFTGFYGVNMPDVYTTCPTFENDRYRIRFLAAEDCADLLKVYSDRKAVPFFNSDNCNGDDFYYTTEERMRQAIDFWFWEYSRRGFVRWSIADKRSGEVVGTIELFRRIAEDFFTDCGLLRLDLRSDYETESEIMEILALIVPPSFEMFSCGMVATKAVPEAVERRLALSRMGFVPSPEKVIGHDGTEYGDYFVCIK